MCLSAFPSTLHPLPHTHTHTKKRTTKEISYILQIDESKFTKDLWEVEWWQTRRHIKKQSFQFHLLSHIFRSCSVYYKWLTKALIVFLSTWCKVSQGKKMNHDVPRHMTTVHQHTAWPWLHPASGYKGQHMGSKLPPCVCQIHCPDERLPWSLQVLLHCLLHK